MKAEIPVEPPVPIVVEVALPEEPTKKVEEGIQKTISMFMKSKSQIEVKQELMSHYNIKRSQDSFSEIYKPSAVFKVNEDKALKNEPIIVIESDGKILIRDGHFRH